MLSVDNLTKSPKKKGDFEINGVSYRKLRDTLQKNDRSAVKVLEISDENSTSTIQETTSAQNPSPKKWVLKKKFPNKKFPKENDLQFNQEREGIEKYHGVKTSTLERTDKKGNTNRYIIDRYFEGKNLFQYKAKNWFEKICICRAAAAFISIMHDNGDIHGDVTPSNFLFDSTGNFVVGIDFEFLHGKQFSGTLLYAPPEVVNVMRYPSRSSDVYELGKTFIEFLDIYVDSDMDQLKDKQKLTLDSTKIHNFSKLTDLEKKSLKTLLTQMTSDNITRRLFLTQVIEVLDTIIASHQKDYLSTIIKHFFEMAAFKEFIPTPPPIDKNEKIEKLKNLVKSIIGFLTPIAKYNNIALQALGDSQENIPVNYPITFYQLLVKINKSNYDDAFVNQVTYDLAEIFANFRTKKIFSTELLSQIGDFLQLPRDENKIDVITQNAAQPLEQLLEKGWEEEGNTCNIV